MEVKQRDLMKAISKKENDLYKMQDALEKTEKKSQMHVGGTDIGEAKRDETTTTRNGIVETELTNKEKCLNDVIRPTQQNRHVKLPSLVLRVI